ncbi:MAG TPA: acyclic terpene utilization AtuA family protein [Trebonia sp.]|nr:acyclic terpene utilization AtuA family protein [Trebonia sp.]
MSKPPIRIANASGFYGDFLPAMRDVIGGGPVDVVTGDYLAELTMLILWKARRKDPSAGYARTFLAQLEEVLGIALDRGVKVVANAGGLNPSALAERVHELAARLGLSPRVAWIDGDDLTPRLDQLMAAGHDLAHADSGRALRGSGVAPLTANAYLGGWGITEALACGADIVITPRVTDASLVTGPAAWWHGWERTDFDQLAGALAAGHVIECGPQATGGNYSFPQEITSRGRLGYPIAEVAADGSSVITKHPGTGGVVSVGTVTAQLLYEVGPTAYQNPDVIAHFDTIELSQQGPDRVLLHGTKGSAPTGSLKVAINYSGGYRNTMTLVLTGLDIESKAASAQAQLFDALGGEDRFDQVDVRLLRFDQPDAPTNAQATAHLQITVKDCDPQLAGRKFSAAAVGLYLGGYAGFHTTTPPTDATEFGVYWPTLVPAEVVTQRVVLPDGTSRLIEHTPPGDPTRPGDPARPGDPTRPGDLTRPGDPAGPAAGPGGQSPGPQAVSAEAVETVSAPLGLICGARSGDKGGNANVGLWTRTDDEYSWLRSYLTTQRLRQLLPEAAGLPIQRHELPNLRALNFVVVGLLGDGVASSTRPDPQAKGLGEYLRSRHVDLPARLARP